MTPEPPPEIVIVFVAPLPDAVTPAPTKLNVVAEVERDDPSSCTVIADPPPPVAASRLILPVELS